MNPRALILHATGTNRDRDVARAIELAGGSPDIRHIHELLHRRAPWTDYQMLVVPGGFSYADALGAGRLLALDLEAYFSDQMRAFVEAEKPVIGICNGFQALVRAGILPGRTGVKATLTFNQSGHFECRWVTLRATSSKCVWTQGLNELIDCPVAHGEGRFLVSSTEGWTELQQNDQIALIYTGREGEPAGGAYPENPNGSPGDVAGVCSPAGNVLGLMPHPENHIFQWQHPRWTRGFQGRLGLRLFENGVRYAAAV